MNPGDYVNVYHDPLTRTALEGRVKLWKRVRGPCPRCGWAVWLVFFPEAPRGRFNVKAVVERARPYTDREAWEILSNHKCTAPE